MAKTVLYENQGKHQLNVPGIGEIKPGERASITSEYLPPVILENYPGLVDITDEPSPSQKGKSK